MPAAAMPGTPNFDGWARDGLSLAALRSFAAARAGQRFALPAGQSGPAGRGTVSFEEMTTQQVLELIVKPATAADGCSYAQLLIAQVRPPPARPSAPRIMAWARGREVAAVWLTRLAPCGGTPPHPPQNARDAADQPQAAFSTAYVVHSWSASFTELLDALAASEGAESAYFWIGAPRKERRHRPFCSPQA